MTIAFFAFALLVMVAMGVAAWRRRRKPREGQRHDDKVQVLDAYLREPNIVKALYETGTLSMGSHKRLLEKIGTVSEAEVDYAYAKIYETRTVRLAIAKYLKKHYGKNHRESMEKMQAFAVWMEALKARALAAEAAKKEKA